MTTNYSELTQQIGDQWIAALKRTEDALTAVSSQVAAAASKIDVPQFPVPEQVTKLGEQVSANLPKPSEIVQANFALTERLLTAQRDFALRLIESSTGAAAPAASATRKSTAKA